MDKEIIEKIGYFASILSIVNYDLNRDALTNQDLAKMLDEKTHEMLDEITDKIEVMQNQLDRVTLQNEIIIKHL